MTWTSTLNFNKQCLQKLQLSLQLLHMTHFGTYGRSQFAVIPRKSSYQALNFQQQGLLRCSCFSHNLNSLMLSQEPYRKRDYHQQRRP